MTIFTVKGMSCGKSITNAIKTLDTAGSVAVDLAREVDIDSGENNLITGH